MTLLLRFLQRLGTATLDALSTLGHVSLFAGQAIVGIVQPKLRPGLWLQHMIEIGFFSLPVVGLTAAFSGFVLVLQSYAGLADLASPTLAEASVPRVVLGALIQELGPVLTGLIIAGRVGAAMAAELGTMRVTEQIDALYTLSTPPIPYLVSPRILAATLMLPVLVIIVNIIGVAAAFLLAIFRLDFHPDVYFQVTWQAFSWGDVGLGLLKATIFGTLIALISTYQGFYSAGGAAGVGRATRQAVVLASITILAANYLITEWLFTT